MRSGQSLTVVLVAVGLMAAGASAADSEFTGAVSSDWAVSGNWTAGVPSGTVGALIGTTGNAGVSATISASATAQGVQVGLGGNGSLEVGGSLNVVTHRMIIGASGGASVTADVVFNADTTIDGSFYNSDEKETHSLDIGGGANANVTIAVGVTVTANGQIGIGKDDRWVGGFETHVSMAPGSVLNVGYDGSDRCQLGLGGDVYPMVLSMDNATVNGTLFQLGGTLEAIGTVNLNGGSRWRNLNALSLAGGLNPVLKFIGSGAEILTYGFQFGIMPDNEGPRVDVSELVVPADTWVTVMTDQNGGFWGNSSKDIDFVPGTDSGWSMQLLPGASGTSDPHFVQVMFSSPQIMGDVNLSGSVDDDDLSLLLANWNIGDEWGEGDLNDSGNVDDDDLSLLLANWGAGSSPAGEAVPEPATLVLLGIGGLGVLLRKKR